MKQANTAKGVKKWIETLVYASLILVPLAAAGISQISWTNTAGGNWYVAANWNPNTVPGSNDAANITANGTYTVSLNTNAEVNMLIFGAVKGTQTLFISNSAAIPIFFTVLGSALVNKQAILTCGSNVTVNFSSNAIVAGTIQPLAGHVIFNQALSLSSSSVLKFPIGGPTPAIQYGTIAVAATAPALPMLGTPGDFQPAGTLNISLANGYTPNDGDTFSLLSFPSKHGSFDLVVLGSATNGVIEVQLPTIAQSVIAVYRVTNAPPPVQASLLNQTNAAGSTVYFNAPAFGVVPYTYQWQFNGTNLVGQTNVTLVIPNAQTNNGGSYCVTVTDALLQTSNYCATLSVYASPSFASQPASQTVSNGSQLFLSATVSSPLPVQYQWRRDGVNIPGANSSTYIITNAQNWHGGTFDLLAASAVGVLVSTSAQVNVTSPPLSFSNFPGGLVFVSGFTNGIIFSGSGNNAAATNLPGQPDIEGNPASHVLWLQFYVSPYLVNGPVVGEFSTLGSDFDTVLAVYTCPGFLSVSNLVLQNSGDDNGTYLGADVPVVLQPATTYYIAVDGFAGATGNVVLNCTLNSNLNSVAQLNHATGPADQAVPSFGGTATFSVTVTDTSNLTYQWNKGGYVKIPGATNSTLILSNVTASEVYNVTVTGTNGQGVDSRRVTLEIGPSLSFAKPGLLLQQLNSTNGGNVLPRFGKGGGGNPAPAGSSFPSVSAGTIGSQLINNYNSYTAQGEPVTNVIGSGGSARWFLLTPTNNGTMQIDTIGTTNTQGKDVPTLLYVWVDNNVTIYTPSLVSDRNSAPDGIHSLVRYVVMPGTNYLIEADTVGGVQGLINLNWRLGTPPGPGGTPQTKVVEQNSDLTLNANVDPSVTSPTCQWQCNGTNIPGATLATLPLDAIQPGQCGSYSVIVSNLMGVVTNPIALVYVDAPLKLAAVNPARIFGSATQATPTVLQLSTNLASTNWTPLFTNATSLLPVNYLDAASSSRTNGFYRLKSPP